METERGGRRTKPVALFMAFGTQGDVYPIAAIAAAFACDQEQHRVILISHSAHESLSAHLTAKNVEYLPVSTPPVLAPYEEDDPAGTMKPLFSLHRKTITREHRQECICYVERIFGYWPSNVRACGFWFLPLEWQFSCNKCGEVSALLSSGHLNTKDEMCAAHAELQSFLKTPASLPPVFIGLSSVGSMGFLRHPQAFLGVLRTVVDITNYRILLFSAGFEPLDDEIQKIAADASSPSERRQFSEDGTSLFGGRLFCFSGSVPYKWLFPRCAAAIHHGGSGSTAAALRAGIPQVVCPFMLDQFYWAERMFWLGVAPEPLKRNHLLPDENDDECVREAANMLARAIDYALSPKLKARALEISETLSHEDGVLEALKIIKEEIRCFNSMRH